MLVSSKYVEFGRNEYGDEKKTERYTRDDRQLLLQNDACRVRVGIELDRQETACTFVPTRSSMRIKQSSQRRHQQHF